MTDYEADSDSLPLVLRSFPFAVAASAYNIRRDLAKMLMPFKCRHYLHFLLHNLCYKRKRIWFSCLWIPEILFSVNVCDYFFLLLFCTSRGGYGWMVSLCIRHGLVVLRWIKNSPVLVGNWSLWSVAKSLRSAFGKTNILAVSRSTLLLKKKKKKYCSTLMPQGPDQRGVRLALDGPVQHFNREAILCSSAADDRKASVLGRVGPVSAVLV